MNKVVVLLLLGLTLTGCSLNHRDFFKELSVSSVRILTPGGRAHGSGFIVTTPRGNKVVITNQHVCEDMGEVRLRFTGFGELEVMSTPLFQDEKVDLCVIGLPKNFQDMVISLPIASGVYMRGKVYALGYPLEYPLALTEGYTLDRALVKVANTHGHCSNPVFTFMGPICVREFHVIQTNAVIYPGNSGSPGLNEDGEVIGVFNSASSETNYGNLIPLDDLINFIKEF